MGYGYSEKLKQELFSLDDEKLKPYFNWKSDGALLSHKKLYGIFL
jgi:peptidyl-dipeptidase Dcp